MYKKRSNRKPTKVDNERTMLQSQRTNKKRTNKNERILLNSFKPNDKYIQAKKRNTQQIERILDEYWVLFRTKLILEFMKEEAKDDLKFVNAMIKKDLQNEQTALMKKQKAVRKKK